MALGDLALILVVGLVTLGDVALDLDSDWFFFAKPLLLGGASGLEDFLPNEKRGALLASFGGALGDFILFCFLRPVARPGRAALLGASHLASWLNSFRCNEDLLGGRSQ